MPRQASTALRALLCVAAATGLVLGSRPLLAMHRQTPFLRSPALIARFCACDILPGFFLRSPEGSYFNVWGEPLRADPALSPDDDARRVEALFRRALSRRPTADERRAALATIPDRGVDRQRAFEDLFWALVNSSEFVFNH